MKRICKNCGYIDVSEIVSCPVCAKNEWEDYEIYQIKQISTDESFVNAMIELHDKDPIEYQLKIQQFRTQMQQQKQAEEKQNSNIDNVPKCPTCQSTNVQKIGTGERVASVVMMGVFSKKINKSFKCKSCGYIW